MQPSPMITVARGRFGSAAAQVLEQVRAAEVVHRDEIAARTGLSVATVGRAVGHLVESGVLRERPDLGKLGSIGRPGTPVEVDTRRFVTIGVHVGRRIATVALGDLTGKVVAHDTVRRRPGADPDLDRLSRAAATLLGGLPGREPLAAGLVGPWRELALDPEALGRELHDLTGLDVRTGDHIAAVAATEFFHRRHGTPGVTLYVYARDTLGFAVAVDKGIPPGALPGTARTEPRSAKLPAEALRANYTVEISRVGSLTHFPTGSGVPCECGRTGCLQATAGDEAVVREAVEAGLVEDPTIESVYGAASSDPVLELLRRRARVLGEVAASVRDIIAPDRVILVGQAFTGCPWVLDEVVLAFEDTTALPPLPVSFTRFGAGIQAIAACTIGLGPVYDDPLGVVPSRRAQQPAT